MTKTENICVKMIWLAFLPIHELRKQSPGFTSLIFTRLFWTFTALGQGLDLISLSSQPWRLLLAGTELGVAVHRAVCAGPRVAQGTDTACAEAAVCPVWQHPRLMGLDLCLKGKPEHSGNVPG